MRLKNSDFKAWGAIGGRLRQRRLLKLRMRRAGLNARPKPKKRLGRPPKRAYAEPIVPERNNRAHAMRLLYREGKTLEEIGVQFGVSRERARQIMKLKAKDGGMSVRTIMKERERQEARSDSANRRAHEVYGVSLQELTDIQGDLSLSQRGGPAIVYREKQNSAFTRQVPWEFTLSTWWKVWQDSGKWNKRGRTKGTYCMARNGDAGPYSPDNVRIVTVQENIAEAYDKHPGEARAARAIKTRVPTPLYLSPRVKEAYDLYLSGIGPKQIAEKMGIKAVSVSGMVNSAKHILGLL